MFTPFLPLIHFFENTMNEISKSRFALLKACLQLLHLHLSSPAKRSEEGSPRLGELSPNQSFKQLTPTSTDLMQPSGQAFNENLKYAPFGDGKKS
jgi:hypothetical protein